MKKFTVGAEYKTIRKSGEIGVRTFKVEKRSNKHMKLLLSGAIDGVYDFNIKEDGEEYIKLGMGDRNYCNPYASDIIL